MDADGHRLVPEPGAVAPSTRHATWNLDGYQGRQVPSGVYFCKLASGGTTLNRRLVVQR
jgi:hypothetical protein